MNVATSTEALKSSAPTDAEKQTELKRLAGLLDLLILLHDEWTHLRAILELQIAVIRNPELDLLPYDMNGSAEYSDLTDDILQEALNAQEWANGHQWEPGLSAPLPSDGWRCQLEGALSDMVDALSVEA